MQYSRLFPHWCKGCFGHVCVHMRSSFPPLRKVCARSPQPMVPNFAASLLAAQGPQGLLPLITFLEKNGKYTLTFFTRARNKLKNPCGPCASLRRASESDIRPCGDLARPCAEPGYFRTK